MRLYIAEKPSLARALAAALPHPHKQEEGFIRAGNGDCVTWCVGHLLEQAPPDAYDAKYKKWNLEHLPISPTQWLLVPKAKTKKQLGVIRKLLKQASEIVHTGDPDREGQLLVDEVVDFIGLAKSKRERMLRCLISDLNLDAVRKSLANLRPNKAFIPLSVSALARARADWLYGMNMTRLCSIQGQKSGYKGVLSVGRVQTPVLGLVVKRDEEIADFTAKAYYEVWAELQTDANEKFKAKWQPSEACAAFQDEEGRVLSKELADNVVMRIKGQTATVTCATKKSSSQAAPLPYNLSALQIDAAKIYGLSAKDVLDICQNLYEKHKLITYPRSDCRYLPEDHFAEAATIKNAALNNCNIQEKDGVSHWLNDITRVDISRRSKAWNNKKVSAHHAIVPTSLSLKSARLHANEAKIYRLIARQYLAQFMPPWLYSDNKIELDISGGCFIAKSRQTQDWGWKQWFQSEASTQKNDSTPGLEDSQAFLPELIKGDKVLCSEGERHDKLTQAPKHFTDATLLAAMTGIARYVRNKDIRKILKETDGLGTEATRAGIVELLFKRNFLVRQGKNIRATDAGKALVKALPETSTQPDMTAEWEAKLNAISQREAQYQEFMDNVNQAVASLIGQVPSENFHGIKSQPTNTKQKRRYRSKKTA